MAYERQRINDVVQMGREATEGVATAATARLAALNFTIGPAIETKQMKAAGSRAHSVNMLNKQWASVTLEESPCTYDELPKALAMAFGAPVITTPGGGTNSRNHVFTPPNSTPMTPVPFTIESGSFVRADRAAGARLSAIAMNFSRDDGVSVSGEGMAQSYTDDVQLTKNATYTLTANATPPTAGTYTLTHSGNTTAGIAFGATPATVQTALEGLASIGAGDHGHREHGLYHRVPRSARRPSGHPHRHVHGPDSLGVHRAGGGRGRLHAQQRPDHPDPGHTD
jgi:hypothetical protein